MVDILHRVGVRTPAPDKVYDALTHEDHVFATTPQAIEHGRDHVHRHALLHEQVAP